MKEVLEIKAKMEETAYLQTRWIILPFEWLPTILQHALPSIQTEMNSNQGSIPSHSNLGPSLTILISSWLRINKLKCWSKKDLRRESEKLSQRDIWKAISVRIKACHRDLILCSNVHRNTLSNSIKCRPTCISSTRTTSKIKSKKSKFKTIISQVSS